MNFKMNEELFLTDDLEQETIDELSNGLEEGEEPEYE